MGAEIEKELVRRGKRRILRGVLLYGCAVLAAFLNPTVSLVLYVLIPLGYLLPGGIDHHWTHSHG